MTACRPAAAGGGIRALLGVRPRFPPLQLLVLPAGVPGAEVGTRVAPWGSGQGGSPFIPPSRWRGRCAQSRPLLSLRLLCPRTPYGCDMVSQECALFLPSFRIYGAPATGRALCPTHRPQNSEEGKNPSVENHTLVRKRLMFTIRSPLSKGLRLFCPNGITSDILVDRSQTRHVCYRKSGSI